MIQSKEDAPKLIQYYEEITIHPSSNPPINASVISLDLKKPIYVLGYDQDSTLAEVIAFENVASDLNRIHGYVYVKNLHPSPPFFE